MIKMVVALEEEKRKCEICGREFVYKSIGENFDFTPMIEIHDLDTGKFIGIHIVNHFICKDCAEEFITFLINQYKANR